MRHSVYGRKLGRDTNARRALLGNLASSLLVSGHLTTTLAKAKFTQSFVEKLITKAGKNSMAQRRLAAQKITSDAFKKLTAEIGPGFKERTGGYTRIIRLNSRLGDAAPMAKIELLKFEKPRAESKETASSKSEQKKPDQKSK